ncbi:MAG: ATP-binding protein [Proteobacteria bacterium]|nr:ATP-binding protein [Pseudomonadota bacterium]MBU1738679.1 ATP-binding protein [Pseudomonadota bacterium]
MSETNWRSKWSKEQVKAMLLEQLQAFWDRDTGIKRAQLARVEQAAEVPHAVVISGLRRVGKSTLLAQMAHRLGEGSFYYVNFEDDRFLGFRPDDATHLYSTLVELFGERKTFVIDEIQNIEGWEAFVRRFMDLGYKFFITGSNASLLSRELGTRLTGRYVPVELFPFSFDEYLRFKNETAFDLARLTTTDSALLQKELLSYLQFGGIPDSLKYPELPLLRTLYDDILYRDVVTRHRVDSVPVIKELGSFLLSNPAALISFNKLKEQFKVGSVNTIKNYIGFLENSWLFFTVNVYAHSVKRQQIAPKKVYCIDTGMGNSLGFSFSPNTGRWLENAIFLALRRRTSEIHYCMTPGGYEVDFFLPTTGQLIQVCHDYTNEAARKREIRALEDVFQAIRPSEALILTDMNDTPFTLRGVPVQVRKAAEWLLDD